MRFREKIQEHIVPDSKSKVKVGFIYEGLLKDVDKVTTSCGCTGYEWTTSTEVDPECKCLTHVLEAEINIRPVNKVLPPNVYKDKKYYNKHVVITVHYTDGTKDELQVNLKVQDESKRPAIRVVSMEEKGI